MDLMSEDVQWAGVPYGWLWRRRTPSSHGPAEARAVLTERLTQLEDAGASGQARLLPGNGNRALVEFRWSTPDDGGGEANLVVTMENGQIVEMKDYRRGGSARRAAGV